MPPLVGGLVKRAGSEGMKVGELSLPAAAGSEFYLGTTVELALVVGHRLAGSKDMNTGRPGLPLICWTVA